MKFNALRMDIAYEVTFVRPIFEVALSAVQIMKSLYANLNPRFAISMADLQSLSGQTMADVGVIVSLFNDQGSIEVRPERLLGRFDRLQNKTDGTVVRDCLKLVEKAVFESVKEAEVASTTIRTSSWLAIEGMEDPADYFLGPSGKLSLRLNAEKLKSDPLTFAPRIYARNEKEKWSATFVVDKSAFTGTHLFFVCDLTYLPHGAFNSLDERAEHLEVQYKRLLAEIGLEPKVQ